MSSPREFVLTLSCRNAQGGVHPVCGLLFEAHCDIADAQQFGDMLAGVALLRERFEPVRAVRWHVAHRVLVDDRKMVVFR